jgi:SAM-dependent methyltransferase
MDWQGDPFEALYQSVGDRLENVPWARLEPSPPLAAWLARRPEPDGARALVIACGLGDDAEALATRGYAVSAFDISPTAIGWCHRRFPDSQVDYRVADLLALPAEWARAFDLVVEIITIQSLPLDVRERAIGAIADTVAPGGTVYVWCLAREDDEPVASRPWPVSRADLRAFETAGLEQASFRVTEAQGWPRFEVTYRRPA